MSLVFCPECGHEVSLNAIACPNCGKPLNMPPPEKKVIVTPPVRRDSFPPWAFVPIVIACLLVVVVLYLLMRDADDTGNVNVAVNARRANQSSPDGRTTSVPSTDTQTVTVPGTSTTVPSTSTGVPSAPAPSTGTVIVNAKILAPRSTSPAAARAVKLYLLEKDVESVLSEANVEPIEGNDLAASLGLAAVYPDRYREFQNAAMRAISRAAKYSLVTDASGKGNAASIAPDSYYLFGVQRVGRGFALWNAPVSISVGENVLNLSPQTVTEIANTD